MRAGRKRGGGLAGGERPRVACAAHDTPRPSAPSVGCSNCKNSRPGQAAQDMFDQTRAERWEGGAGVGGGEGGRQAKCSLVGSGLLGCAKFASDVVPASLSRDGGGHARGGGAGTCTQGRGSSSPWSGSPSARLGERPWESFWRTPNEGENERVSRELSENQNKQKFLSPLFLSSLAGARGCV